MQRDHHGLVAEAHILQTKIAHLKTRSKTLLDMRLDGEVTKDQYHEKRAELDLQQAEMLKRLDQLNSIIEQGEDDLEEALQVANQLPELWAKADAEERRGILEAVFVRFIVGDKKVADVEVRPPYSWLMRWTPEIHEIEESGNLVTSPAIG